MSHPKILIFDIETSHNLGYFFDLAPYDRIPHENIVKERCVLSVAWKWLGEKKVHSLRIDHYDAKEHDDKAILEKFLAVLETADAVVAHYGDKFDVPFLNGRFLINGLNPFPLVKQIDTYKIAKKHFKLNSNKLDYLGRVLGFGGKMSTPKGLWIECVNGNILALNKMEKYNRQDVELLEKVFLKLAPFAKLRYNISTHTGAPCCPSCGSNHIQRRGTYVNTTAKYQRLQCQSCGSWFAGEKIKQSKGLHK